VSHWVRFDDPERDPKTIAKLGRSVRPEAAGRTGPDIGSGN